MLVIGLSAGGTPLVKQRLAALPQDYSLAVAIVAHLLDAVTDLPVTMARDKETILKIDKSFIDDIPYMAIASTIIAMGHTLGFKILAEGVETPEQLAFLQEKGCDNC